MIAFLDVNTIWRLKFADALRDRVANTILVAPHSGKAEARRAQTVRLPRGWAGPLARLAMPWLFVWLLKTTRGNPTAVVLTTPHYLRLARMAARRCPVVYYCSDDYRSYAGWDPAVMARQEHALCRMATLSIFVSEALRARAVAEYGLDPAKTMVSPNATEPRFAEAMPRPPAIAELQAPVFGVAGVFNRRIDLDFLVGVASDPRVGSIALVGPIESDLEEEAALGHLRDNPKVVFLGAQSHEAMPQWMASFDVAMIPYAKTEFNRFCSPMRLYDHLAIGQPIIATRHCEQVAARDDVILADRATVADAIDQALTLLDLPRRPRIETWLDRIDALQKTSVAGFLFRE